VTHPSNSPPCPHCGYGTTKSDSVCRSCGGDLPIAATPEPGTKTCPACFMEVDARVVICGHCRRELPVPATPRTLSGREQAALWIVGALAAGFSFFVCSQDSQRVERTAAPAQAQREIAVPGSSVTIKRSMPACLTRGDFDELGQFRIQGNTAGIDDLERRDRCFVPSVGVLASVLERPFAEGSVKLRLYTGDGRSIEAWTYIEAIE